MLRRIREDRSGGAGGTPASRLKTTAAPRFAEDAKLTASDGAAFDEFGYSVAISGDAVVVSAHGDDDSGSLSGSAYVFVKPVGGWSGSLTEDAKLTASDAAGGDVFGASVAISGDTVVVGANGDDDNGDSSGSAYVFEKPVGGWDGSLTEDAKLNASDAAAGDWFGLPVAISGDTLVAGARFDDDFGSAYVFAKPVGGWSGSLTEDAKLTASDGALFDQFGVSVAISGDTVVAGAWGDGGASGSAYVFAKPVGGWSGSLTEDAKLTASDGAALAFFGFSVAISGDTVVVGAYGDDNGSASGSAYVFVKPVGGWSGSLTEDAKLTASDAAEGDVFGKSVAMSGDTAVGGAYADDDNGSDSGSAYVFSGVPPEIFSDGFESGDTSAWSITVP